MAFRETPWERVVAVHWGDDVNAWVVGFTSEARVPVGGDMPGVPFVLSTEGDGVFQELTTNFQEDTDLGEFGTQRIISKIWRIAFATQVQLTMTGPAPDDTSIVSGTISIGPAVYEDGAVVGIGGITLSALHGNDVAEATTPNKPPTVGPPPHPTGATISGHTATLLWVKGDNPRLLPP